MRIVVDALWEAFHDHGVSWVGFYLDQPDASDERRLVLGPCRDKPACSPIGLHGVCGQALTSRQTRIVEDVATLGPNYIACDPRDRSEIVIPLQRQAGLIWITPATQPISPSRWSPTVRPPGTAISTWMEPAPPLSNRRNSKTGQR
jgi:putative methionine-R-sulfoxide reductase with GAF domain